MALLFQKVVYELTQQLPLSFRKARPFIIFCACLLVSQVSSTILIGDSIDRIGGNSGVAFGLPIDNIVIYILIFSGAILFLFFLLLRLRYLATPLALILAGGASNGLDRLLLGFVRDPIHIVAWHGNIADILIGVGMLWAIWEYLKR